MKLGHTSKSYKKIEKEFIKNVIRNKFHWPPKAITHQFLSSSRSKESVSEVKEISMKEEEVNHIKKFNQDYNNFG